MTRIIDWVAVVGSIGSVLLVSFYPITATLLFAVAAFVFLIGVSYAR